MSAWRCQMERKRGMTGVHARPQTIVITFVIAAVARPRRAPHRRRHCRRCPPVASAPAMPSATARRSTSSSRRERIRPGALADRDRALVRTLVATVLRRLGTLRHLLGAVARTRPAGRRAARRDRLLIGAAQILFLDVPDHAAVDLAVRLAQADRRAAHYAGLVNAVLRRVARDGTARLAELDTVRARHAGLADAALDRSTTAPTTARAIAARQRPGAGARSHGEERCRKLGGDACAAACCRPARCARSRMGRSRCCPASPRAPGGCRTPPPRCRRGCSATSRGKRVADLCAAPGGKTAQLAHAGAQVTAVDRSAPRLERLRRESRAARLARRDRRGRRRPNGRAGRSTRCCSMRPARRPARSAAIPTSPGSSARPTSPSSPALQRRLLDRAAALLKPGGTLVYCTCSLEPEEGERADRGAAGARCRRCAAARSRADEVARPRRTSDAGRATCAPCPAIWPDARSAHGRARRLLCRPARNAVDDSTACQSGWPRLPPSLYVDAGAGRRAPAADGGGERVDGAACRSRNGPSCP